MRKNNNPSVFSQIKGWIKQFNGIDGNVADGNVANHYEYISILLLSRIYFAKILPQIPREAQYCPIPQNKDKGLSPTDTEHQLAAFFANLEDRLRVIPIYLILIRIFPYDDIQHLLQRKTLRWSQIEKWFGPDSNPILRLERQMMTEDVLGLLYQMLIYAERQARGAVYTPYIICRYIIDQTLQPELDRIYNNCKIAIEQSDQKAMEENIDELHALKVLDPATGTGIFVVEAFRRFIRTYQKIQQLFTSKHNLESRIKEDKLSLRNWSDYGAVFIRHIVGIDSDPTAIQIAQINIWLEINRQLADQEITTKTDLGFSANLIVEDTLKSFDLLHSKCPEGYVVIIGNPPYQRAKHITDVKGEYRRIYSTITGACDIYIPFFELGMKLLRPGGILGLITSNKYLVADYGSRLRDLLNQYRILEMVDLTEAHSVFSDALISPLITICQKSPPTPEDIVRVKILKQDQLDLLGASLTEVTAESITIEKRLQRQLRNPLNGHFEIYLTPIHMQILDKIYQKATLYKELAIIRTGIMGFDYHAMESLITDSDFDQITLSKSVLPVVPPSLIAPYEILWGNKTVTLFNHPFTKPFVRLDPEKINTHTCAFFRMPKIIIRGIAKRLTAAYDDQGKALLVAIHGAVSDKLSPELQLALLNSTLFNWIHRMTFYSARIPRGSLRYPISFLANLPIRTDAHLEKRLISLVRKRLTQGIDQKTKLQLQNEIDAIVFQLYGLSQEEIHLIGSSR